MNHAAAVQEVERNLEAKRILALIVQATGKCVSHKVSFKCVRPVRAVMARVRLLSANAHFVLAEGLRSGRLRSTLKSRQVLTRELN